MTASTSAHRKGPAPRPELDRFWPKVHKTDTCWLWTASHNGEGYGHFYLTGGKKTYAHRWAYKHFVGPIPTKYTVDHLCRVPLCVNPTHLEAVTHRENCLRGVGCFAAHYRREDCGAPTCKACRVRFAVSRATEVAS